MVICMHYIVFDLEFNQDFTMKLPDDAQKPYFPFEIIQIGAVKLNSEFQVIETFNRYVKPTIYPIVSPFIIELTGITTEQLAPEKPFPDVYQDFLAFIDDSEAVFCSWGKTDMKELYRSVEYFQLNKEHMPKLFLDIQPFASLHLNRPKKMLLRLQYTVEELQLPLTQSFHDALHDALYTADVLRAIYNQNMQPIVYHPTLIHAKFKPRQVKKIIDFEGLLKQFEKMYQRPMTEEEQSLIKLAYQMGKTGQFLKEP